MAGNPNTSPDSSSGSASDELTPPTMKFGSQASVNSSGTDNTIRITQATVGNTAKSIPSPASMPANTRSAHSKTVSDATSDNNEVLSAGIETQDLLNDPLLLAAPRVDFRGKTAPCLNGIPMLAMIGRGGMGAVYYGVHPRLRSEVAVKVLPFHLAEQDQGMVRRFFREAQIAAQVRSPHLVNVMDVNEEAGLFFLVMEFVPGRTAGQVLKHYLEKNEPMSEKDTLDVIIAATEGLWAAHGANVVHRDIKPENIMVPYVGRGSKEFDLRRAKLMDLGLARNEDSNQSLTGAQAAMGTPGYMAPEQAMDAKTADKRSDVFSMGATIYCMLNGKPPFRGETVMKILMATMHEPHEPIIKLRPDVSPMLNEICERCLGKKQEHRFSDAKQLLAALEDCKRLVAGGMSGSIPTPGTFQYRPSATPAPGSGTNVTQMGLPSSPGTAAPAAAKGKKGMLLIGGGVAAAIAAGAVMFALSGPGKPKIDAERRIVLEKRFGNDLSEAEKLLAEKDPAGNLGGIRAYRTELFENDLVKADETFKKKVDDLDKRIAAVSSRSDLQKKGEALGRLLDAGKVDEYKKLLPEAEVLATDDFGTKLIDGLRNRARGIQQGIETKKLFSESLGKVRKAIGDKDNTTAQTEFAAAKKLIPDSPDLAAVEKDLKELDAYVASRNKISDLQNTLKQKQTAQDWKGAHDTALEIQLLDPRNQEIGKLLTELSSKLGAEDLKKKEEEQTKRIAKIFSDATEFQKNGDLEEAERALQRLIAVDPKHAGGQGLLTQVQKQIADRDAKLALDSKRRTVDDYLTSVKQLLDGNGDIDVAAQKIDSARKEVPDDLTYQAKIDKIQVLVDERRDQLKNQKEADALLEKAGSFVTETNLDKLKEAQGLISKASRLVPKYAKATDMAAKFDKKIEEQLKLLAQNKDAHDRLVTSGDKNTASATGKPLTEQQSLLELALSDYEDAKKMQPTGPAAKKVDDVSKRILEIKDQLAVQRKIEGLTTGADSLAARGNFDDAIKALADLKALDATLFQKKTDEYTGRKAKAEQLVTSQLQAVAQKASAGRMAEALSDARTLRDANVARTDLVGVVTALDTAVRNDSEVRSEGSSFRARVKRKEGEMKGGGATEHDAALAQIQQYEVLVAAKVKAVADANFAGADGLGQALRDARTSQRYNADAAVTRYEAIPSPRVETPPTPPVRQPIGEQNPFEDKPKVQQPQPQPKPKRKGSVGEGNIDD